MSPYFGNEVPEYICDREVSEYILYIFFYIENKLYHARSFHSLGMYRNRLILGITS